MQDAEIGGASAGPTETYGRSGGVPERHGALAAFEWLFARLGFPVVTGGAMAYAIAQQPTYFRLVNLTSSSMPEIGQWRFTPSAPAEA